MSTRGGTQYDCMFSRGFLKPGIGLQNWVSRTNYPALNVVADRADRNVAVCPGRLWPEIGPSPPLFAPLGRILVAAGALLAGGELVTKPLTFTGSKLLLNFATSAAGDIRVEIQDADGNPLPGYSLDDASELIGNEIERAYSWKTSDDVNCFGRQACPPEIRAARRRPLLVSFSMRFRAGFRSTERRVNLASHPGPLSRRPKVKKIRCALNPPRASRREAVPLVLSTGNDDRAVPVDYWRVLRCG